MVTGLVVKVDGSREDKEWEELPSLEEMQKIVGGYIERVLVNPQYFSDKLREQLPADKHEMIVNEDGRAQNLRYNSPLRQMTGYVMYGDVLIFNGTPMEDDPNG